MLLAVEVVSSGDSGVVGFVVLDDVIVGVELPLSDGVVVTSTVVVVHVTDVVCSVVDIVVVGGGVVGIIGTTLLGGKKYLDDFNKDLYCNIPVMLA